MGAPIYNRCKTHERCSREKASPDIWWFQKVVVPLHSQLKREGYPSELGDPTGQRCLIRFLERCMAGGFGGFLPSVASGRPMDFLIPMGLSKKNFSEYLVVSKNLLYLCTHNPQEKGSSLFTCEEVLSWSSSRGAGLTGITEAIFDIFHN